MMISPPPILFEPGNFSEQTKIDGPCFIFISWHICRAYCKVWDQSNARSIASTGPSSSTDTFHISPDGADVFPTSYGGNWYYYLSNAESKTVGTD